MEYFSPYFKSFHLHPWSTQWWDTHVILYDLFDPGHSEDEDEWDQCGVATGRWYIRDLLQRVKIGDSQDSRQVAEWL